MPIAKNSVVSMYYELKDANTGELLESNLNAAPLSFILGKGQILEGLEAEIEKLDAPSNADIILKKDKALGEYDEKALQTLPKEQFAGIDLQLGMELFGEGEDGSTVRVSVKEIKDDEVVIDYNHAYAGKDLLFSLNLLEAREASEDEILTGVVAGSHSCGCDHGGHHDHHGGGCCGGCGCH